MPDLLSDAVALLALVALLVVAYRHPRRRVEASVSVVAAAVVLATGLITWSEARDTVAHLAPVVLFLVAILVTAHVCDRAGLFAASGRLLRHGGAVRLLTVAFLVAAAVTAVLSLDATAVLLTPIVVAAARAEGVLPRPGAYACLRMANSASLLLPVSNLTNLLALPALGLTFTAFAATMAPVTAAVLVVEYVGLRLLFRRDLDVRTQPHDEPDVPLPLVPTAVVIAMLAGFALTSPLGLEPAWVAGAAAIVLTGWAHRHGLVASRDVVHATHPEFVLLVLALGVVVAAISEGFLGEATARVVPDAADSLAALLLIAGLATALANVLTNLSATLLLVPLVAPLGDVAVLAALIGLNVGSGLTMSGSLANLLWRRTLAAGGDRVSVPEFHRVALLLTPCSVLVAVLTLYAISR
ncbi:SLC13 family permease [Nocardioides sp. GXZ039]|uniref:SLC13 family permease n=1 Tax=Nocardioides sp. GXZ039 TaxID=3136018 RepID=UPI0030F447F8